MICTYCGEPGDTERHPECNVAEAEHALHQAVYAAARDWDDEDPAEWRASSAYRAIVAAEERLETAEWEARS